MEPNKDKKPSTSKPSDIESIDPSTSSASTDVASRIIGHSKVPPAPHPSLNSSVSDQIEPSKNTNVGQLKITDDLAETGLGSNTNTLEGPSTSTNTKTLPGPGPTRTRPSNNSLVGRLRPTRNLALNPSATPEHATHVGVTDGPTSAVHYQSNDSNMYNRSQTYRRSPTPSVYTLEREVNRYITNRESAAYQYYPGAEIIDYDYVAERSSIHNTNLVESTAHLIKGSLGAGVLSMHEAYMNGGLWTSLGVTILIGILLSYAMLMLIKSAQQLYVKLRISKLSYPDLAEAAAATSSWTSMRRCSKVFRYTVDLCLFLVMSGTCCIYQIMIAHTLRQAVEGLNSSTMDIINLRLYILMSTPGLLLLCLIRSLKFLAPFAMLADIFVAMCVLTSLYYSFRTIEVGIEARPAWKNVHGFVRFCGICMYCTSGICVALPVENNMRKPRSFHIAMKHAMIVVVILTCMTGFFGYWGWGEECKSPITVHMPQTTFTTILQFLLVIMLCTTFAVQFWVPFRIVWHYIVRKCKRKSAAWERVYRLAMAVLVTAFTLAFPDIIPVMIFLGQFLMGFVGIVFPAIIELLVNYQHDHENKIRWRLCKNLSMVIFGLFLSVTSFYSLHD